MKWRRQSLKGQSRWPYWRSSMLKVIELFSGVGAQAEALKRSEIEHEVVAMCDIDKYSVKTYRKLHGCKSNQCNGSN